MRLHEHYFETYAPTPDPIVTRMMQAISCGEDKHRAACDIKHALLHSKMFPKEWFIVRLTDWIVALIYKKTGRKLAYVIAYKGQYGAPPSPLYWARERDQFMHEQFS